MDKTATVGETIPNNNNFDDDVDDDVFVKAALFAVSVLEKEEAEMAERLAVIADKIDSVMNTLKRRLSGNESEAVIKKLNSKIWDELYPGAIKLPVWTEEDIIQTVVDKQLSILNRGRVNTQKDQFFRKDVTYAYACRVCLSQDNDNACTADQCFLLHPSRGLIKHMEFQHAITLPKGALTAHLTIQYELPIRVHCEGDSTMWSAKSRMDRLEAGETVYAEDGIVLGDEPTVYNKTTTEYANDQAYVSKHHLYQRTPIQEDQQKKLNLSTVNVYDLLKTIHDQLSMDPDEFSRNNITAQSLMPDFVFCESDITLDDIRYEKKPTDEHEEWEASKKKNSRHQLKNQRN